MTGLTLTQLADLIIEASYTRVEELYPRCNPAPMGTLIGKSTDVRGLNERKDH